MVTEHANLSDRVRNIIADELAVGRVLVTDDARLIEQLGAEVFDIEIVLTVALEDAFKIQIPETDACEWRCVRDVIAYVERTQKNLDRTAQS
jgi:acyl carrier protein